MNTKTSFIAITFLVLAAAGASAYLYPQLPERVASHWNATGEVDGYMPKFWGLFLMPIIAVGMALLLWFLPKIDPMKENVARFRGYYNGFIVLMVLFLTYLHGLTLLWHVGRRFNMVIALLPAFSVLWYAVGVVVGKAKRNWFLGIRTPWTLSSDEVWDRTHRVGGILFKISSVVALLGLLVPRYAIAFVIVPVVAVALFSMVYSYVLYKRLSRGSSAHG